MKKLLAIITAGILSSTFSFAEIDTNRLIKEMALNLMESMHPLVDQAFRPLGQPGRDFSEGLNEFIEVQREDLKNEDNGHALVYAVQGLTVEFQAKAHGMSQREKIAAINAMCDTLEFKMERILEYAAKERALIERTKAALVKVDHGSRGLAKLASGTPQAYEFLQSIAGMLDGFKEDFQAREKTLTELEATQVMLKALCP